MTTLIRTRGDLLALAEAGEFDMVIQGCNCWNTMGGGIARQIASQWPEAVIADNSTTRGFKGKLGSTSQATITRFNKAFTVVNAYTQFNMSSGEDVFEYVAFSTILKNLAEMYVGKSWGLPEIGMGLARGDPEIIIPMIEVFADVVSAQGGSVTLVTFGKPNGNS